MLRRTRGENAQDSAHSDLALLAVDGVAERTDVRSGATGSPQQLGSAQWCLLGVVFFFNAIPAPTQQHLDEEAVSRMNDEGSAPDAAVNPPGVARKAGPRS